MPVNRVDYRNLPRPSVTIKRRRIYLSGKDSSLRRSLFLAANPLMENQIVRWRHGRWQIVRIRRNLEEKFIRLVVVQHFFDARPVKHMATIFLTRDGRVLRAFTDEWCLNAPDSESVHLHTFRQKDLLLVNQNERVASARPKPNFRRPAASRAMRMLPLQRSAA